MSYLATVSNSLAKSNIVTEPRVESRSIAVQSIGQQLSSPRSRSCGYDGYIEISWVSNSLPRHLTNSNSINTTKR